MVQRHLSLALAFVTLLVVAVLSTGCFFCSNGEGYCGGKPSAKAYAPDGNLPTTGNGNWYYQLDADFTCIHPETGQRVRSYVDAIYGDSLYVRKGNLCVATEIEVDPDTVEKSVDGKYLGIGAAIYERRELPPTFGSSDAYTEAWCRMPGSSGVLETYLTRQFGAIAISARWISERTAVNLGVTKNTDAQGIHTYAGNEYELSIETNAGTAGRIPGTLSTPEETDQAVLCRILR